MYRVNDSGFISPEGGTSIAGGISHRNGITNRAASPEGDTLCDNDRIVSPSGLFISLAFQDRWLTPPAVHISPSGLKSTATLGDISGAKNSVNTDF